MSILKKRRIDYLSDDQYDHLKKNDPKSFKRLQEHQQNYKKVHSRIEMLKRRENKTKELKEELKEWKSDLTATYNDLTPLNEDFEFRIHLTKRKKDNSFYLKFKTSGTKFPTSVYLGTREKIIDHLTKFYGKKKNIKREWYFMIKREIGFYKDEKTNRYVDGIIYANILDRVVKNPTGFHKETWNLENVFPLQ